MLSHGPQTRHKIRTIPVSPRPSPLSPFFPMDSPTENTNMSTINESSNSGVHHAVNGIDNTINSTIMSSVSNGAVLSSLRDANNGYLTAVPTQDSSSSGAAVSTANTLDECPRLSLTAPHDISPSYSPTFTPSLSPACSPATTSKTGRTSHTPHTPHTSEASSLMTPNHQNALGSISYSDPPSPLGPYILVPNLAPECPGVIVMTQPRPKSRQTLLIDPSVSFAGENGSFHGNNGNGFNGNGHDHYHSHSDESQNGSEENSLNVLHENEMVNFMINRGKSCPIPTSPRGVPRYPFGISHTRETCGIASYNARTVLTPSNTIPVNDDTLAQALSVQGGRLLTEELEKSVAVLVERLREEKYNSI